jgi:hypothetical protein
MEKDWFMVFQTEQLYLAEIAKQILYDSDIEVIVINKKDSTYLSFGELELYVHKNNLEIAIDLLKDLKIE